MARSTTFITEYFKHIFQNSALADIGDASGLQPSATAGSLYVALYITDPTDADTGTEANYTGYARISVVRSAVGWTVSGITCKNTAVVTFPISTGVDNTITHFGIRTALSGGDLIGSGKLSSALLVVSGDTPKADVETLIITGK